LVAVHAAADWLATPAATAMAVTWVGMSSHSVRLKHCDKRKEIWFAAAVAAAKSTTANGEAIRRLVSIHVKAMPTAELPTVELRSVRLPAGHLGHFCLETSCLPCTASESIKIMTSAAAAAVALAVAPVAAVTAAA